MTAPAAPSVIQSVFGSSTEDHNVSMHEVIAAGRLLVAFISTLTATPTTPTGWSLIDSDLNSLGRLSIYAREADGTEGGTTVNFVTASPVGMKAHVYYFSEDGYTIADCISAATGATGSSSAPDAPSRTTGWGSTDFITLAAAAYYSGTITAAPSGYSGLKDDYGGAFGLATAYKSSAAASSENPGAFTASANPVSWAANTVCVRLNPSPPAPDPPTISGVTPSTFAFGEQIVISGADFGATKGTGKVELSDNATYASGTKQVQSVVSWADGSITINTVQGGFSAGAHYVWVTNDNGDRNSTGSSVTATEDEPEAPPAAPSGTVLYGPLQVQIYGSPPVGMIEDVFSAEIEEGVNRLPSASFSSWLGGAGVSLATGGAEVGIRRVGEGELFRGFIEKRTITIDDAGAEMVGFQLAHLGIELQKLSTGRSILVLDESVTAAATAILDGSGWSFTLTGSGYQNVTKEWVNMPLLQAIAELAEIANAYWRVDPVSRSIEISNVHADSGIVLTNLGDLDPAASTLGAIERVERVEEDVAAVVNRVWFEIKTDQARLVTLQESTRSSPYTIQSETLRPPRVVSFLSEPIVTQSYNTPFPMLGENRYALATLIADAIDDDTVATIGGRFMSNLEQQADSGGSGESAALWGGIAPPKGEPSIDFKVTIGGPTISALLGLENVDQVSPIIESDLAAGSSTSPTITVDSETGSLVVAFLLLRTIAGATTITPAAGTELVGKLDPSGTALDEDTASGWQKEGGASTTTLAWTLSLSQPWLVFAVSFRPAKKYYIEDSTSQSSYGVREMPLPLGSFGEVETDNEALANAAYDYISDYLTKRKDPPWFCDVACSFLPGSPLAWEVGDTMATKHRGSNYSIDDDLIVTTRRQSFGPDGARKWGLELSTVAMFRRDEQGVWLMQQILNRLGGAQANQV